MRNAPKFAIFAIASVALGSTLAMAIPTDPRSARNSALNDLSAPKVVGYPGADKVIAGQDSYPVVYSPQYLAVLDATERQRLQGLAPAPDSTAGYDQPDPARDAAFERGGVPEAASDVTVHRGSSGPDDGVEQDPAQFAEADAPEG